MNSSTTLLSVRFNSFIITASDGRIGSTRYSRSLGYEYDKSIQVGERACVTVSGNLYLIDYLVETLKDKEAKDPQLFANIYAKEVVDIVFEAIGEFARKNLMTNGVMVVGHGKSVKFETYWIESKMVRGDIHINKPKKIQEKYFVKGSGESYLKPYMAKIMKDCDMNMSEDDAIEFVMKALNVAVEGDWGSGGLLRAVVINADEYRVERQHQDNPPYIVIDEYMDD